MHDRYEEEFFVWSVFATVGTITDREDKLRDTLPNHDHDDPLGATRMSTHTIGFNDTLSFIPTTQKLRLLT